MLGQTRAYAVDANLTSDSGDVVVDGRNTATLDVRNKMQVIGDTAVSVVLAYNQVGYESSDLVTQTLDALLGGDYSSQQLNTAMGFQELNKYDRVLVGNEHEAGGTAGRNYLYLGSDGSELDLGAQDYSSSSWADLDGQSTYASNDGSETSAPTIPSRYLVTTPRAVIRVRFICTPVRRVRSTCLRLITRAPAIGIWY